MKLYFTRAELESAVKSGALVDMVWSAIDDAEDRVDWLKCNGNQAFGLRVQDEPTDGQYCELSREYSPEGNEGDILPGTCAISLMDGRSMPTQKSIERALNRVNSYYGDYIYLVYGAEADDSERQYEPDDGEVVICSARNRGALIISRA